MTEEQLIASWDEPIQKSSAFTIGLGTHSIWIFEGKKSEVPAVILKDQKVIGWTKKE